MNTEWIKKSWKDPVGSKVIAAGIIFLIAQILIFVWGLIIQLNFIQVYKKIFVFFSADILVKGWFLSLLLLIIVVFICLIIIFGKNKFKNSHSKRDDELKTNNTEELVEPAKTKIGIEPTVFFHHRFCDAFPGTDRGVLWLSDKKDINRRLDALLHAPTKFDIAEGYGITSDPIWWFRSTSAVSIDQFKVLDKKKVLINFDEFIVEKIAAYRGLSYYRDFVYVQCLADKPTGLYKHDPKVIESYEKKNNEYTEEFGIYNGRFVTRQEYDDGSAIIKNKLTNISGVELRCRTLTRFNFIIAAKFSPYNCVDFTRYSDDYFHKILNDKMQFDDFVKWLEELPKNPHD
jgi:hypothetical protein